MTLQTHLGKFEYVRAHSGERAKKRAERRNRPPHHCWPKFRTSRRRHAVRLRFHNNVAVCIDNKCRKVFSVVLLRVLVSHVRASFNARAPYRSNHLCSPILAQEHSASTRRRESAPGWSWVGRNRNQFLEPNGTPGGCLLKSSAHRSAPVTRQTVCAADKLLGQGARKCKVIGRPNNYSRNAFHRCWMFGGCCCNWCGRCRCQEMAKVKNGEKPSAFTFSKKCRWQSDICSTQTLAYS